MFKKKIKAEVTDFSGFNSLNELQNSFFEKYADLTAITDEYAHIELTYKELQEQVKLFATGLQSLGVKKGDFVGLFTENNGRWIVIDQAIISCGAADVVRGSNAPVDELCYITLHADCKGLVIKDEILLNKLKPSLKDLNLEFIILMFNPKTYNRDTLQTPIYTYDEIIQKGKESEFVPVKITRDDLCTIIYTSGTTGMPKGVMLTHSNYLRQLQGSHERMMAQPGEGTLEILPIWHAYERLSLYYFLTRGCHCYYTTLSGFKKDLLKYHIDIMMSVPRIWEAVRSGIYNELKQKSPFLYDLFSAAVKISITYKAHKMYGERRITNKLNYNLFSTLLHKIIRTFLKPLHVLFLNTIYKKVKKAAGLNFRTIMSGGGAISMRDELFYDAIGIDIRSGYGLTETTPVLTVRGVQDKNFLGSVGTPMAETEIKIVDPQTHEKLGILTQGLVMAKGPQIMKGYLKDEKATKAVLSEDGWFNTGDLGWLTKDNNLVIIGRIKETIVLSSGENVEPTPIEEACLLSPYIEQIVLVGQDKSGVGALIVPSKEALEKCGINMKNIAEYKDSMLDDSALKELIKKEINQNIVNKPQLKPFEKIKQFILLATGFSIENGLMSQSTKIKRNKVFEKYRDIINKMYEK